MARKTPIVIKPLSRDEYEARVKVAHAKAVDDAATKQLDKMLEEARLERRKLGLSW